MTKINVEIVYATPDLQKIIPLQVDEGTTLLAAVLQSNIQRYFPQLDLQAQNDYGIFSHKKAPDYVLRDGDRVEIYRPLLADPKQIRRERAKKR